MNDEFLHRIRKPPSPEFLAELKAKLDRQSAAPKARGRWSFTRGLITGLLLGGAAFGLTAVSLTRGPESLHSLVRTPAEYFARVMSGRASRQAHDQDQAHDQHRAAPLGPVWLPDRAAAGPAGQTPNIATQSTGFAVEQNAPGAVGSAAPAAGSTNTRGGAGFPAFEVVRVVASSDAYPFARITASDVPRFGYHMTVELDTGNSLERLCNPHSTAPVDAVELSRRITPDELSRCTRGGIARLVELKIGYQALALARARLYGSMRLTARDLFLALARKIPDPARPGKFINNQNTTWNQVDSALPYDRIQVIGPATGSAVGKLAAHLLLQAGCDGYPGIVAMRDSDPGAYEDICGSLRADGSYVESTNSAGWAYLDELAANPTAVGLLRLNDPSRASNSLLTNPVDSIEPTQATVAAGAYPVAETIYLYANKSRLSGNQAFASVVRASLTPRFLQPDTWAFVPLDAAEREANLANALALKELQF